MNKPSIWNQLVSLSSAVITQVAAGCPVVSDEKRAQRAQICSECPSLDAENYRCNECGCFLKWKIVFSTSSCPLNKWEEKKDNEN
jgi:hypothetical protein